MHVIVSRSLSPDEAHCIPYAAVAAGEELLLIHTIKEEYISLGRTFPLEKGVDPTFRERSDIPIRRGHLGGAFQHLTPDTVCYALVTRKDRIPPGPKTYFRTVLQPVIHALRERGLSPKVVGRSDIQLNDRKVSDNTIGDLGEFRVMTGLLYVKDAYTTIPAIYRVPYKQFRDRLADHVLFHTTSLVRDGLEMDNDMVMMALADSFIEHLPELIGLDEELIPNSNIPDPILAALPSTIAEHKSDEWLSSARRLPGDYEFRVKEGLLIRGNSLLIRGKAVEVTLTVEGGSITAIDIFADESERKYNILHDRFLGEDIGRTTFKEIEGILFDMGL